MCLAIYKPPGKVIPEDHLVAGFSNNPHGAGFAVVTNGTLLVQKGLMTLDEFMAAWEPHVESQAIIHFRWATHGSRGPDMTHPFWVNRDLAMIHNGVLDIDTKGSNSDTAQYVEEILAPMAKRDGRFFLRDHIMRLGSAAIRGSKFCFLRRTGAWAIWNADAGIWDDEVWYSNAGYKRSAYYSKHEPTTAIGRYYAQKYREDGPLFNTLGVSHWDGDTPVPAVEGVPDDPVDKHISVEALCLAESKRYKSLRKDEKFAFEELVAAGWDPIDLDDEMEYLGDGSLEKLYKDYCGIPQEGGGE